MQALRDLLEYMRRYPFRYGFGLAMLVFSGLLVTLVPIIMGRAIDGLSDGTMTMQSVWLYIGGIIGATALTVAIMITVRRMTLNASWEIQFDIRHDLFSHFTRLDANYYDNHRVGDLMARLTADLNAVRMYVGVAVFQGVNIAAVMGFTLYRMFTLNVSLTLLTLLMVPVITLTFFLLLRVVHRRYERVQEQFSEIAAMAQENFSGIRVVKGFGIENRELRKFGVLNDVFIQRNLALTRADGPMFPLMEVLFGTTISLLVLIGGRQVLGLGGDLTIGEFSAFLLLFEGIQWPMIALGWIASLVQRGSTSWFRLKEILLNRPAIQDDELTDYNLTSIRGDIEFQNVSARFDTTEALKDVSFRIAAGESIGITGRTGSGKTTLINLIARVMDPTEGRILVDGIDIRRYPVEVLRRHIGMVPQEPFLFSDTIADNIAYGLPADDSPARAERIREVSKLVQLDGDVMDFPKKYETSLGERGVTLSGGQRQRTALARAIIREPSMLILDDSLSAVDTQTESLILEGLKDVQAGRTSIIVAHRVSAFQDSDRILVLEQGRIVEQGTMEYLLEQDGWYADIDRRQRLEEDLEQAE